ncbi:hypothetical protein Tcan_00936, partial [Toxocara canis]
MAASSGDRAPTSVSPNLFPHRKGGCDRGACQDLAPWFRGTNTATALGIPLCCSTTPYRLELLPFDFHGGQQRLEISGEMGTNALGWHRSQSECEMRVMRT